MGKRKPGKRDIDAGESTYGPSEQTVSRPERTATTPATLYSLHQSTNATETGLGTKVAKAQKVLVGKRVWEPRAPTIFDIEGSDVLARACQRDAHLGPSRSKGKHQGKHGPFSLVDPNTEYQRWRRFTSLRKLYQSLCRKVNVDPPPVMSFERWHFSAHCREASRTRDTVDPLIPHPTDKDMIEPCLVQDLERCGVTSEQARELATTLAQESRARALEMRALARTSSAHETSSKNTSPGTKKAKGGKEGTHAKDKGDIIVTSYKHTLDVSLRGTQKILKLTTIHYKKLRTMFNRELERRELKSDGTDDDTEVQFNQALYCLLTRYHALLGHGYQAAIPEHTFDTLREYFGVSLEGFASPLNSHFANYCSAFVDTDHPFGSLGSFFDFHPKRGSFEVNPPFVSWVMVKAVNHMTTLLDKAEAEAEPLCFIVVVPGWEEDPAWHALTTCKYNRKTILIARADHGFCDGAQHQRKDRFRESPFDTGVFILQTSRAHSEHPVTRKTEQAIRLSMAEGTPTTAAKERRLREGRGLADADGAGKVYRGKKRKQRASTGEGESFHQSGKEFGARSKKRKQQHRSRDNT